MSQDACESRATIYDERAKPVLSVFFFLILIKKKSSCFYKGLLVFFATRVGCSYLQLEKLKSGKIKTKKSDYVQIEKIKTKKHYK